MEEKGFQHVHHNYLAHEPSVHGQEAHTNSLKNDAVITPLLINSFSYYSRKKNSSTRPLQPILCTITVMEVAERGERNEITFCNTKLTVTNDSDCVPPSLRERDGDGEMKERHKQEEGNRNDCWCQRRDEAERKEAPSYADVGSCGGVQE